MGDYFYDGDRRLNDTGFRNMQVTAKWQSDHNKKIETDTFKVVR